MGARLWMHYLVRCALARVAQTRVARMAPSQARVVNPDILPNVAAVTSAPATTATMTLLDLLLLSVVWVPEVVR